ncbi:hypothetical protein E0Z10_g2050 [Xylaria hypoxylon]|uniref:Uncharacterized protein n=1 Tax=Xylaria hypoxylon TaxID=37992 RepID=A0A4Z0ZB60_9PEZI|nr:hypothetical protein E0Z10_g2050 [Xylaria hypoxylon]
MSISRRQESRLRLETLGHLSDHYSDVASIGGGSSCGSIDDESQWELDSNSSKASTLAVVFDKGPPPGHRMEKSLASESMRPSSSGARSDVSSFEEHRVSSMNSSLAKKPYVIHGDLSQPHTFNTSQLRPAKGLRRTRHPSVLRPGATPQRAGSEYGVSDSSMVTGEYGNGNGDHNTGLRHPAVLCPGQESRSRAMSDCGDEPISKHISDSSYRPHKPSYSQTAPRVGRTSRYISTYSAYRPQETKPSQGLQDHTIRASVSLCESPYTYYGNDASNDDDARSNYSNATYSYAPRPANNLSSRRSKHSTQRGVDDQRSSQFLPYHPSAGAVTRVDGVDFEMVSTAVNRAPAPITITSPASTSSISPARGRGRQTSTSSISSRSSRSPSPAYGAWNPDPPRQNPSSFLQRAQARLERSVHEKLVKAGRRPAPSFNVIKVEKSPTGDVQMWREEEGQKGVAPPPSIKGSWRERIKKLQEGQEPAHVGGRGDGIQLTAPAPPTEKQRRHKESWEISSGSEAEIEFDAKPFHAKQTHVKASRLPAPGASSVSAMRRGPDLRVDTSFADSPVPAVVTEFEVPRNQYGSAVNFKTPLDPPVFPSDGGRRDEESGAGGLAPTQSSDDSLFLGGGKSGMRHPASYSFFSSEYAQRRVTAEMEGASSQPPRSSQAQLPRAQSSPSLYQEDQDKGAELSRTRSSVALTWEQVQFASLPSPLEDLWHPFPFDNRRELPSQMRHQDAVKRRTLSKKKGMQLR